MGEGNNNGSENNLQLGAERFSSRSSPASKLIEILPVQQIALEGFDHLIDFPFGAVVISHQLFDAVPIHGAVKFAVFPLVKEFTVLLADILFVFSAIFNFHLPFLLVCAPTIMISNINFLKMEAFFVRSRSESCRCAAPLNNSSINCIIYNHIAR
jgi:hypothetical protein